MIGKGMLLPGDFMKEQSGDVDNSLRGAAIRRAETQPLPKTLTPYEWQQWYAEHGVPQEHRTTESWLNRKLRLFKTLLAKKTEIKPPK